MRAIASRIAAQPHGTREHEPGQAPQPCRINVAIDYARFYFLHEADAEAFKSMAFEAREARVSSSGRGRHRRRPGRRLGPATPDAGHGQDVARVVVCHCGAMTAGESVYTAGMSTKINVELPTFCAKCGAEIQTPSTNSAPCPNCGSLTRIAVVRKLPPNSKLCIRVGDAKERDSPQIIRYERGLHRQSGKPHRLIRFIDRVRDRYAETVIDESIGQTVRNVREPLTQHRGHGDAKSKR